MPKRARSQKRDANTEEGARTLQIDAERHFEKLLASSRADACGAAYRAQAQTPSAKIDMRLLGRATALTSRPVKKYCREMLSKGERPSLDALHNLAMAVRNVVESKRSEMNAARAARPTPLTLVASRQFKQVVCKLVAALWSSSMASDYFQYARRGADSFRSFASGVCYSLKRGLTTPTGAVIVPPIPEFAAALPTARAISAGDATLRSLHAASHAGLCSLRVHRVRTSGGGRPRVRAGDRVGREAGARALTDRQCADFCLLRLSCACVFNTNQPTVH